MPEFKPFRGIRYDTSRCAIDRVTAPPYDVIDSRDRAQLVASDPHNIVRIDLPDEVDGPDRYDRAAATLSEWIAQGILLQEAEEAFYIYRMDYRDDTGTPVHTMGVLGALALSEPEEGQILPHEYTTPKAKTDRLDLLRATRTNLSAIWGLSLSTGLTEHCRSTGDPAERWLDPDGVTHSLWVVTDTEVCARISASVAASPIVIADGHHRFETSLTYRDERRAAGDNPAGAGFALVYVVELIDTELTVHPINRLLTGITAAAFIEATGEYFMFSDAGTVTPAIVADMASRGALVLVGAEGDGTFCIPRPEVFDEVDDLDSARLAKALEGIPGVDIRYQHGTTEILDVLTRGEADCGVLLRPATVAQIRTNAHEGRRMPPKTTFFHPKPRTGQVFRSAD